jgi:hypothetical protein
MPAAATAVPAPSRTMGFEKTKATVAREPR